MTGYKALRMAGAIVAMGMIFSLAAGPAAADTLTWSGTAGAAWSTSSSNWNGAGVTTPWDLSNGTGNIAGFNTLGASATVINTVYANGIQFDNTATISGGTVSLVAGGLTTPTVTVNTSGGTIASVLAGTAGLLKNGTGLLVFSAANIYSGGTAISGGTLQVGNGGATGNLGTGSIVNNANLVYSYNTATALTLPTGATYSGSGNLSATGKLYFGSGTLAVGGAFGYNGTSNASGAGSGNAIVTAASASLTGYLWGANSATSSLTVNTSAGNGAITLSSITSGVPGQWYGFNVQEFNAGSGPVNIVGTNTFNWWNTGAAVKLVGQISGSGSIVGARQGGGTYLSLTFNNPSSGTYSGVISSAVSVVKDGAGTQVFTGANTYTGSTTITAGTLQIGAGSGNGALAASSAIIDNGTLSFSRSDTITQGTHFSSAGITGSGGLVQMGPGTLVLNAANSYSGATTVSGGALLLSGGALSAAGATSVAGGATFGGSGSAGTATIASGGNVQGGYIGTGSLSLAALSFGGTANVYASLASATPGATAPLVSAGALTTAGSNSVILNVTGLPGSAGTYHFIQYGSLPSSEGFAAFRFPEPMRSMTLVGSNAGYVDIAYDANAYPIWTGTNTNAFRGGNNWRLSTDSSVTDFMAVDSVRFDDTAAGATTVDVGSNVNPGSVTFNNAALNYTLQGSGAITTGSLLKAGSGTLTITNSNSYASGTTLAAGVLQVGNNAALGVGTLTIAPTAAVTFSASGTAALTLANPLAINGNVTLGSATNNGVLNFTAASGSLTNNPVLTVNSPVTISSALTGASGLTKDGSGILTLNGASTYSGSTTISAGTLNVGAGALPSTSAITIAAGATLADARTAAQIANVITGSGTWTLSAIDRQWYSGTQNFSGFVGTLNIPANARFWNGQGTNQYPGAGATINVASGGELALQAGTCSAAVVIAGNSYGSDGLGALRFQAGLLAGNVTLSADARIEADSLSGGTLAGSVDPSGRTLSLYPSSANLYLSGTLTGSGAITNIGGSKAVYIAGNNSGFTGTMNLSAGSTMLNGSNLTAPSATITMGGGTLNLNGYGATVGGLNGTSGVVLNNSAGVTSTLTVNPAGASSFTYGGVLTNGSGTLALTKSGGGTLVLAGTNTYTGATSVNQGTLAIGSSLTTSPIAVGNDGTLAGTGTAGNVTVAAGGTVQGGYNAAGMLTVQSLTFSDSGNITATTTGTAAFVPLYVTSLAANGAAGSVAVNAAAGGAYVGGTYHLLQYAGSIGGTGTAAFTMGTYPGPLRSTWTLTTSNAGYLDAVVVMAPGIVWTGAAGSEWSANPALQNWNVSGGTTTYYMPGDAVTFDDTAAGGAVNITGSSVGPTAVTFNNNSVSYTLSSTGGYGITSGTLTKNGTAALTINTANSYTGGSSLNGGTVTLGNSAALGTSGNIRFGGSTLQFTASNTVDYSSRIKNSTGAIALDTNGQNVTFASALDSSNSGGLTKSGSGALVLSVANALSGPTTVSGGTLQVVAGALPATSAITIGAGATLVDARTAAQIANVVTGSGTWTLSGIDRQWYSGTQDFSGFTGTLNLLSGARFWNGQGTNQYPGAGATINVANGAQLSVAAGTCSAAVVLSGTAWSGDGLGSLRFQNGSLAGNVTLAANARIYSDGGVSPVLSGSIYPSGYVVDFSPSTAMYLNGSLSGSGTVIKSGGGTLYVSGDTSGFTGPLNLNAGTLVFQSAAPSAFLGSISGGGSLIKAGTALLTLPAANNYTGNTTVSGGTLEVPAGGAISSGAGAIVVGGSGGATLVISGGYVGNTVGSYGAFMIGNTVNQPGTVTMSGGTLNLANAGSGILIGEGANAAFVQSGGVVSVGNGSFYMNGGTAGLQHSLSVSGGSFTSAGICYLNVWGGSTTITVSGSGSVSVNQLALAWGNAAGGRAVVNLDGGTLKIGSGGVTYGGGYGYSSTGTISFNGGTLMANASSVSVASNANLTTIVNGGGAIIDTQGYTMTFNNPLTAGSGSGPFGLTKLGAGTLLLNAGNSYTGGTTLNGGTLKPGNASALGPAGGSLTVNGGTLDVNNYSFTFGALSGTGGAVTTSVSGSPLLAVTNTADCVFAGTITNGSGMLRLAKDGAAVLTLLGNNTYTGLTSVNGGTLALGNGGTSGEILGNVALANSAALLFNRSNDVDYTASISGSGSLIKDGTGTLTLEAANSHSMGTVLRAGGLLITDAGALGTGALTTNGGTLDLNGLGPTVAALQGAGGTITALSSGTTATVLTVSQAGTTTFSGQLRDGPTQKLSLNMTGAGNLVLANSNSFSGTVQVASGKITVAHPLALENATALDGNDDGIAFAGGITAATLGGLQGTEQLTLVNSGGAAVTLSVGNNGRDTNFSGILTGSGGLTKTGTGTLTLSGNNDYRGGTSVNHGTLRIATANALPTGGNMTISSGGHVLLASGLSHAISLGGLTITSGAGAGTVGSGKWEVGGGQPLAASPVAPAQTPEPGTFALLAAGALAGLALWKRKRRT